jgi:hypothetical protein
MYGPWALALRAAKKNRSKAGISFTVIPAPFAPSTPEIELAIELLRDYRAMIFEIWLNGMKACWFVFQWVCSRE